MRITVDEADEDVVDGGEEALVVAGEVQGVASSDQMVLMMFQSKQECLKMPLKIRHLKIEH